MDMHRPLFISSSLYGFNYVDCTIEEYYSESSNYIEGQSKFQEEFETDLIPCPIYLTGEIQQMGAELVYKELTAPIISAYADEVKKLSLDDSIDCTGPFYDYFFTCLTGLKEKYPDKKIFAFISSPTDFGIMAFGMPKWIEMLLFEEELYFQWLNKFIIYHSEFKKKLIDKGVSIIAISNVFLNNRIIGMKYIQNKIIPYLNKHRDDDIPVIIHSSFMPLSATIKCLEGYELGVGYVVNETDNMLKIHDLINPNEILVGNMGSEYIYKKQPSAIERKVYELLEATDDFEQFIYGTTGADLDLRTTKEQINAIYKGMKRYESKYGQNNII